MTLAWLRAMPRGPRRRPPASTWPGGVELEFANALVGLVRRTREDLEPLVAELPDILDGSREDDQRRDAGKAGRVRLIAARARELAAQRAERDVESLARMFGLKMDSHLRRQLNARVKAVFGTEVPLADASRILQAWVGEAVSLIHDLPRAYITRIEQGVVRALAGGVRAAAFAKELEEELGIARKRARLIARDQLGKLQAQVSRLRNTELGSETFIWSTMRDERVRPTHRALNGRRFSWATGAPGEGLPGQPIRCRCLAEPDFDALLAELNPTTAARPRRRSR